MLWIIDARTTELHTMERQDNTGVLENADKYGVAHAGR